MSDRYRLGGLENNQLLAAVAELVRRENDSLSDLLAHLAELDERELCLELGYSSLFAYCTQALGFSKSSAGRRIAAARACREYPEAFVRIANGDLELSVLCALRQYLNAENASELLATCSHKSYEQVEELLAARFPKPDVRDLIRRLPEFSRPTAPEVERSSSAPIAPDVEHSSSAPIALDVERGSSAPIALDVERSSSAPIALDVERKALAPAQRGTVKPLSAQRFSVNFTADAEFRELLEEVRALVSHAEPKGDLMSVMKRGLQALRGELLKKRFGVGTRPRNLRSRPMRPCATSEPGERGDAHRFDTAEGVKASRHVPAEVARAAYSRDDGRCTFCSAGGRRCEERAMLQLDHVIPYAAGGEGTVGNLRLRCRAHNLLAARVHFGKRFMRAAAMHARSRVRTNST